MRFFVLFFLLFTIGAQTAAAQVSSDGFGIRLIGPADTEAPTTPVLLSVTPVAWSQINLEWSPATDNAIVSGYVVYRDGAPVATTSLVTYADAGLAASTTYSYTVRAFDPSFNYSSSSNALATTTPAPPPPPPEEERVRQESTAARVVIDELSIETGVSTSSFSLETAHQARIELRFGRSASYELGYVMSDVYTKAHTILLTELEPGTTYEYELIGYTPVGFQTILKRGTFTTLEIPRAVPPPNVSRFTAVAAQADVTLSWELPLSAEIAHVRIVRSHLGFPEHPQDGAVVYQGLGGLARDVGILNRYSPVYYTAFVFDPSGLVSSGAVALVYRTAPAGLNTPPGNMNDGQSERSIGEALDRPVTAPTTTIATDRLTIDMQLPRLSDISLTQQDRKSLFSTPGLTLDTVHPFTIAIPKRAVSGNLKSIIATIQDPADSSQQYAFLLRINQDRTAYEATIAPLSVVGSAHIVVEIYDYEAYVVGTYQAPVTFQAAVVPAVETVVFPDLLFSRGPGMLIGLGAVLVVLFILLLVRRWRDEDNQG